MPLTPAPTPARPTLALLACLRLSVSGAPDEKSSCDGHYTRTTGNVNMHGVYLRKESGQSARYLYWVPDFGGQWQCDEDDDPKEHLCCIPSPTENQVLVGDGAQCLHKPAGQTKSVWNDASMSVQCQAPLARKLAPPTDKTYTLLGTNKYCMPWHPSDKVLAARNSTLCTAACSARSSCVATTWYPNSGDCFLVHNLSC